MKFENHKKRSHFTTFHNGASIILDFQFYQKSCKYQSNSFKVLGQIFAILAFCLTFG